MVASRMSTERRPCTQGTRQPRPRNPDIARGVWGDGFAKHPEAKPRDMSPQSPPLSPLRFASGMLREGNHGG